MLNLFYPVYLNLVIISLDNPVQTILGTHHFNLKPLQFSLDDK